jgi:hypothetical protein
MHHSVPTSTGTFATEHLDDLMRDAQVARLRASLPGQTRYRTPRRRAAWWIRVTARAARA